MTNPAIRTMLNTAMFSLANHHLVNLQTQAQLRLACIFVLWPWAPTARGHKGHCKAIKRSGRWIQISNHVTHPWCDSAISTVVTACCCDWLIWSQSLVMWSQLPYLVWWEAVCQFPPARVHMCMNVSVFPEEMDVFQDTKLFSHQTAYPGGTQHLLSGTKLQTPPGKTDRPVQRGGPASKGQRDEEKISPEKTSTRQCIYTFAL